MAIEDISIEQFVTQTVQNICQGDAELALRVVPEMTKLMMTLERREAARDAKRTAKAADQPPKPNPAE